VLSRRGLLVASLVFFTGCPSAPPAAPGSKTGKLSIVTTTGMVTDLVRAVAGDRAEVVGLMNEGVDPHLFKPTVADTGLLLKADVIIYSGLHLEGRMEEAFEQASRRGIKVISVTEGLPKEDVIHPAEGHPDPHVWGNAALWGKCSQHVADELSKLDAAHADEYASRAKDYQARLQSLHEYALKSIASIPETQRHLVTAHDAFSYFSHAYDIPVRSVQGITTDSEPGVRDIVELRKFLVEKKIPALFTESSVNERMLQAVIEGAREDNWTVKVSGTLYSDAMGKADTYEGTYEGMFDHNVTTITRALGGEAPENGFNGKLKRP
jgi:manganese/zinc/iron transport system substrate-binding protein